MGSYLLLHGFLVRLYAFKVSNYRQEPTLDNILDLFVCRRSEAI
jgi:hypothetical protein